MGEVYLARDTSELGRDVALKILPAEVAKDTDRLQRFKREARNASALNHPNILTIHEIGEDGSRHFIATEFVAGETLRLRLERGPLPVSESVEIACQVGAALKAAHEAGIIHRDIKPENVMVRGDALVKVLDFGLAKSAAGGPEAETLIQSDTQPGIIIGTVAYMSPQQARGQALDRRTDVWSLGVVLYEMLSGRQPFRGETTTDTLANILQREPEPLDLGALPADLAGIVGRMLAKSLEARYPTVADALADLRSLQKRVEIEAELQRAPLPAAGAEAETRLVGPATAGPLSGAAADSGAARGDEGFWVAVLPFKYRGGNSDLEELAEGLSEEIVTGLSRFAYLRVVARSSTIRSASGAGDVRNIGGEPGARYILEGSLRQASSALRVSAQLIDAATGARLRAETYDRPFSTEDIFSLQDELVPRIVSTVADQHGVLVHGMAKVVRNKSPEQLTPYEAVLSVFGFHERMSPEEHARVRDLLERVVRDHPDQGNCWAMLETLYCDEYMFGFNPRPDPLGRALAAARRAAEAAPTSNLACQALAQAHFFRREFAAFRPLAERAISLNRMDGATVALMGVLIACSGDWERGCAVTEEAMQLNPHFPGWYRLAVLFDAYRRRDYRAAIENSLRINIPGYFRALVMSAAAHGQLGETAAAEEPLRELLKSKPGLAAAAREELGRWFDAELVEQLIDGLRKAGLEIA